MVGRQAFPFGAFGPILRDVLLVLGTLSNFFFLLEDAGLNNLHFSHGFLQL